MALTLSFVGDTLPVRWFDVMISNVASLPLESEESRPLEASPGWLGAKSTRRMKD